MTTESTVQGQPAPPSPPRRRTPTTRDWVRSAAVVVVTMLVVSGLFRAYDWWTSPEVLDNMAGGMRPEARPVDRSQWTFGIARASHPTGTPYTVTFRGAPSAVMPENTAQATVVFTVCTPPPAGETIGNVYGTGRHYCSRLTPIVEGTTLQWPSRTSYILATVTPHRAGTIVITGANFDYALGRDHQWRRGIQHLDLDIRQRVLPD